MDAADRGRSDPGAAAAKGRPDRAAVSPQPVAAAACGVTMSGFRPRLLPTLFTASTVLLCLGLGVWQLERLQWKQGLIAQRDAVRTAAPVAPPRTAAEARALEFHPVVMTGVFLHDKEIH